MVVEKALICILAVFCGLSIYPSTAAESSFDEYANKKIVIAHRGASGYLPEHTLEAKVLAYSQGADYIEQDVVMSKDDELIVFHDLYLDRMTNVKELFPNRYREDGHFYVVDFLLSELKQLSVSEGFTEDGGASKSIYPQRFPIWQSSFSIHTLQEEIELIQGMNQSTGGNVGIYVELKSPWFFHQQGKDLSSSVLRVLKEYGYDSLDDKVYVQTFDFIELKRLKLSLLDEYQMDLKLVQLIAENEWLETFEINSKGEMLPYDYSWMHSAVGMATVATFANGIGPSINMIIDPLSTQEHIKMSDLVVNAHSNNMEVHPYTFRSDKVQIPAYASSFDGMLGLFLNQAKVDGVFTDFPDKVVRFLKNEE